MTLTINRNSVMHFGSERCALLFLVLYVSALGAVGTMYDLRPFHFILDTCNNTGRLSPPPGVCQEYYQRLNRHAPFVQSCPSTYGCFTIPYTGNYTVRMAGAAGGSGACSRNPGKGEIIEKGTSACETNPTHPVCVLDPTAPDFTQRCVEQLSGSTTQEDVLYDGGGGGGGFTAFLVGSTEASLLAEFIAAGGGGSPALPAVNSSWFQTVTDPTSCQLGTGSTNLSAGAGGVPCGVPFKPPLHPADGGGLEPSRFFVGLGGHDCLGNATSVFPNTVGGYGAGGGGCGNGGGGGGLIGGSVVAEGSSYPGGNGVSFVNVFDQGEVFSWTHAGYNNEGHGFVDLFYEGCNCVYDCVPHFAEEVFECVCPEGSILLLQDCLQSEELEFQPAASPQSVDVSPVKTFSNFVELSSTRYLYGVTVEFTVVEGSAVLRADPGGLSSSCVLLFTHEEDVVASSEIVRVDLLGGARQSSLIANLDSGRFVEAFATPVLFSGVDLIGIDVQCTANVSWNASIRREPDVDTATALLSIADTLLLVSSACNQSDACTTLTSFPAPTSPAALLSLAVKTVVGILVACAALVVVLVGLLALVYYKHRRRKVHLQIGRFNQRTPVSLSHYQILSPSSAEPLLLQPKHQHKFNYIAEKDNQYIRLREREPAKGIGSVVVSFREFEDLRRKEQPKNTNCPLSRENLVFIRKLGEGQFGEVMLMVVHDFLGREQVPVAVKLLQSEREEDQQAFFEEIDLMKSLRHTNIVFFLGHCGDSCGDLMAPPLMILEYMDLGDLLNLLIANKPRQGDSGNLTDLNLCSFAVDVARALQYLSEMSYVHRDVAARNVLVSHKLVAKLADFGLTQLERTSESTVKSERLPVYWLSPESINYKRFTVKSDVWSYGVLLWEMVTYGEFPYDNCGLPELLHLAKEEKLGLKPPSHCFHAFKEAISQCQSNDPKTRPTFAELATMFSLHCQKLATGGTLHSFTTDTIL